MADNRYLKGQWQGNRISPMQVFMQQANDPIKFGWTWDKETETYRLNYAGMEAELRRPTADEKRDFDLTAIHWLVQIGWQKTAYTGLVVHFTPEVKRDLCQAATVRILAENSGKVYEWPDNYGLEDRIL